MTLSNRAPLVLCLSTVVALLAACGSVYHKGRNDLPPQPEARVEQRAKTAEEMKADLVSSLAEIRALLATLEPGWMDRLPEVADRLELRSFELERAAQSVQDVGTPGPALEEAKKQVALARTARSALSVCRIGPPERGVAAVDEVYRMFGIKP
ncbi:MAG: hypothetical protein DYG92_00260 [Leptolyngbya sp. PLA1]|nr:hypothetical protein [Leptolyngbya sp. PLA1]